MNAMPIPADLDHLRAWVGRSECRRETLTAAPLAGLAAMLDRGTDAEPAPGTPLPPLAHWLYFLPRTAQRELGPDGHARRGGFLPPVPLPRRMWAGGRLRFERDLKVGDEVQRTSTITRVDGKSGRSGPLVFVTVRHELSLAQGLALREEHDIVYRGDPPPGHAAPAPARAPTDEQFSRHIQPDPVWLFRYSALTFNGHRIHYDHRYVTEAEGYPGLVVHGPLIATLLVDLVRRERPSARIHAFDFKAIGPLFDPHPFTICGKPRADGIALWARDHEGHLAMQAQAVLD